MSEVRLAQAAAPRRLMARGQGQAPLLVLLVVLATWELVGRAADFLYFPPLSEIGLALWAMIVDGTIPREILASLGAFAAGMAISVIGGLLIGALMGLSRIMRMALDVFVDALMTAPVVAFVPLFILIFGLGFETRVVTVVLFAIFPVIINTAAGIRAVDRDLVMMSRSFCAAPWTRLRTVGLPAAYPHIQTGLRAAASRGVDGVITGEVLIASVGVGGLINRFGNGFAMPQLYAVVFVIVALVLLATRLVDVSSLLMPARSRAGA